MPVQKPDKVWCAEITHLPMKRSWVYLLALMDWRSRAVLSWRVSNAMDASFCVEAFEEAVRRTGRAPEIFNTDQGSQFTSRAWREALDAKGVRISMDGNGAIAEIQKGLSRGLRRRPRHGSRAWRMDASLQSLAPHSSL
jgi:putative transposase